MLAEPGPGRCKVCPLLAGMLGAVQQPRMTSACCNMLTPLAQVLTLPKGTQCEG